MATSERQKIYNQRYREKQAKIKRLARQLDDAVVAMEKLPKCSACRRVDDQRCDHTGERRERVEAAELARNQLQQLEH